MTSIARFANDLMVAVVNTGAVTADNIDLAVDVIRAEIKALLTSDDYAGERDMVLNRSVHSSYVMASVVASCVLKIREG